MGINVGFEDPYSSCCLLPEPSDQIMLVLLGGFATGRCRVDGMAIDCGWAMQMLESGSAVQCPNNNCGPRTLRAYDSNGNFVGRVLSQPFQAFADGYSGFLPPGARYQGNGYWGLPGTGSPARSGPPTLRPAGSRPRGSDDGTNEGRSYRLGVTPQRLFNHPQNSHDPRVDFRNYAYYLSNNGETNDCLKLALMVYKAGQAWGGDPIKVVSGLMNGLTELAGIGGESDSNYRVGVMRRDPYYGSSFGSGGFLPEYRTGPGDNQVRHFIGWLGAGFNAPSFLARRALYTQEGTSDPRNPDVALGLAGIQMGGGFNIVSNYENYKDLAQSIWRDLCGGKGDLKLP